MHGPVPRPRVFLGVIVRWVDLKKWQDRNERVNADRTIAVGMTVSDGQNCHGVVVKILEHNPENPIEEHGAIYIWQDRRTGYGDDNCEHYAHSNWGRYLRIED